MRITLVLIILSVCGALCMLNNEWAAQQQTVQPPSADMVNFQGIFLFQLFMTLHLGLMLQLEPPPRKSWWFLAMIGDHQRSQLW